jgi:uncharacterized protein YcaQ
MEVLDPRLARRLAVDAAALRTQKKFGNSPEAVLPCIEHLGALQIDSISVVLRAHHHMLASRIPGYREEWLAQTLSEGKLFEYWSHAASFMPVLSYPFAAVEMQRRRKKTPKWFAKVSKKDCDRVLESIKQEGPKMARDFSGARKPGGWWNWKPAKMALEKLYFEGSLIGAGRKSFQKIYDLPERIIPSEILNYIPSETELWDYRIFSLLQNQGLARLQDLAYLRKGWKQTLSQHLKRLEEEKMILALKVGKQGETYWALQSGLDELSQIRTNKQNIRILSPFDPVLLRRDRCQLLFNFNYTLECYLPESKRRYGYFSLPLLLGNDLIGRINLKRDLKQGVLYAASVFWEAKAEPELLDKALQKFARQNSCERFEWIK